MTVRTQRARILRLRSIEHRLAKIRLATADGAVADLVDVANRLDRIGDDLVVGVGPATGATLVTKTELSQRLVQARTTLTGAIEQAMERRDACESERGKAAHRENFSERMLQQAHVAETAVRELRRAANTAPTSRRKMPEAD